MSTGPYREKRRSRPVAKTRAGRGKPSTSGLGFLPAAAVPIVLDVLGELGLGGIPTLVCLYRLSGAEIARCALEGNRLVLSDESGNAEASWVLPEALIEAVANTLDTLRAKPGRKVSDLLDDKVTPEVRRRLAAAGHPWAVHVQVGMHVLHRLGDAAAAKRFGARPDVLRAWRRSSWASFEEVLPLTTDVVAADYDEAEGGFWQLVESLMGDEEKAAFAELDREDSP